MRGQIFAAAILVAAKATELKPDILDYLAQQE
jgi:hypothetical protein